MLPERIAMVLALTFVTAIPVSAGTITFTPLDGTAIVPDPASGRIMPLRFQVGFLDDFESVGDSFTAIVLHIGVDGGPVVEFEFGDLEFTLQSIDASSVFDSGFLINAVELGDGASLPFDNIGIVTVDATGAPPGEYILEGHGVIGSSQNENEAAFGAIALITIPEPATLSLLALGAGVFVLSKRRSNAV